MDSKRCRHCSFDEGTRAQVALVWKVRYHGIDKFLHFLDHRPLIGSKCKTAHSLLEHEAEAEGASEEERRTTATNEKKNLENK